jgi:hypothetical protein
LSYENSDYNTSINDYLFRRREKKKTVVDTELFKKELNESILEGFGDMPKEFLYFVK